MSFTKGQSGNPAGRTRGSGDKTQRARRAIDPHITDLIQQTLQAALAGDQTAANALMMFYAVTGKP